MVAKARGGKTPAPAARRRRTAGPAQNDAEEAMEDAAAELNDTTAALDGGGESAPPALPDGLLQRRLDKEKQDKAAATLAAMDRAARAARSRSSALSEPLIATTARSQHS